MISYQSYYINHVNNGGDDKKNTKKQQRQKKDTVVFFNTAVRIWDTLFTQTLRCLPVEKEDMYSVFTAELVGGVLPDNLAV